MASVASTFFDAYGYPTTLCVTNKARQACFTNAYDAAPGGRDLDRLNAFGRTQTFAKPPDLLIGFVAWVESSQ